MHALLHDVGDHGGVARGLHLVLVVDDGELAVLLASASLDHGLERLFDHDAVAVLLLVLGDERHALPAAGARVGLDHDHLAHAVRRRHVEEIGAGPAEEARRVVEDLGQHLGAHHRMEVAVAIDDARVAKAQEVRHHRMDLRTDIPQRETCA